MKDIDWNIMVRAVVEVVIFTVIGLGAFGIALAVLDKLAPFSIHKEIEEDQNVALGIVMGSVLLGLAIIIAAAIRG